jgi:hypothetical protein
MMVDLGVNVLLNFEVDEDDK